MKNLYSLLTVLICISANLNAQAPVINSFYPVSGPPGTQVVITGSNFSANPGSNIVTFGAIRGTVVSANSTSLTVSVPLGATYEPISIAVNNLIGYSQRPFTITYAEGGMDFTPNSFAASKVFGGVGGMVAAKGDLNGDRKIDLVSSNYTYISVSKNTTSNGTVSFTTTTIHDFYGVEDIEIGDLNGDGLPEMVVMDDDVTVLKNNSSLTNLDFSSIIHLSTGTSLQGGVLSDLDNDGKTDIIVISAANNTVSVFRNTSVGGNISFGSKQDFPTGLRPEKITAGDLDGDNKPDIAVACEDSYKIYVYKNLSITGTISFEIENLSTKERPRSISIGDLDGDRKNDIVVGYWSNYFVSIFPNTTTSALSFATRIDLPNVEESYGLTLGDVNGDGKPEIVTANLRYNAPSISVYKNKGTPGNIGFETYISYPTTKGIHDVAIADLNSDGLTDILGFVSGWQHVEFLKNQLTINPGFPECTQLLEPAAYTVVPYGMPYVFKWRKDPRAISYTLRLLHQNGTYIDFITTDTTYTYEGLNPGIYYRWTVLPLGTAEPAPTCAYSVFWTCDPLANSVSISAEGNTEKCPTDSVKLTASSTSNVQWFLNKLPITGAMGSVYWAKAEGGYTVRIISPNNPNCYSDPSNSISVSNLVPPVKPLLNFQNDTALCEGNSLHLISSVDNNNQWFKNNTAIQGAVGSDYYVTEAGSYFVRITQTTSGCHNYSDTVNISVNPIPVKPTIAITGDIIFCNGGSVSLQSSAINGNQWYKNGSVLSTTTSQQYTATQAGVYTVKTTQNGCESAASAEVTVVVNPIPVSPTITATGNLTFCSGDSVSLQSSESSGNQWYKDGIIINGAVNPLYQAKTTGTYTVTTTQNNCSSTASATVNTIVNNLPDKPVISTNGSIVSTTNGYTSYQWYLNGILISGATASQYTTTQNGVYKVEVSNSNGCKISSDNFNFVTTGINDVVLQGYDIRLFPNPVRDDLTIKVSSGIGSSGVVIAFITDATGKLLKQQALKNGLNAISLKNMSQGWYSVTLKSGTAQKSIKFLKMK